MISGKNPSQSVHPPHLTSSWSSSLIPFCAFKADLNISKNPLDLPGLTFPLCSDFLPTILEGQLCYKLTLNQTSDQGKENQLMLILDYNEDRSLQTSSNTDDLPDSESSRGTMNFGTAVRGLQGASAKVQINTLSPNIGFGGGIYGITDVKRMTAEYDFIQMPFKDRNCEVELYEDCRTRMLLKECNCVPWEAPGFKVRSYPKDLMLLSVLRTSTYAAHKEETALRRTLLGVSTAVPHVKGFMLMSGRWMTI